MHWRNIWTLANNEGSSRALKQNEAISTHIFHRQEKIEQILSEQ